jgi:hypothetical protein
MSAYESDLSQIVYELPSSPGSSTPIPAYFNMSDTGLALILALLTAAYFLIPEIAFNWRELTHRRA